MQLRAFLALGISTLCVSATFGSAPSPARADEVPPHMKIIAGYPAATKAAIAQQNVTALDLAMFGYYDEALAFYKSNILAQHPVIMALFSGAGGKFILYRPGKEPLTAEPVPMSYQLLKSVAHSTMALFEVTGPHLDNPADQSWVAMLQIDRAQQQAALRTLGDVDVKPEWRDVMASVLTKNIAFMGRVALQRRRYLCRPPRARSRAGAAARTHGQMGRAHASRSLDGGRRRLEDLARQRLG